MDLRQQLKVISDYRVLEAKGLVPSLQCPLDDGAVLHYVDHDIDRIFFECLLCKYRTYPGSLVIDNMQATIKGN